MISAFPNVAARYMSFITVHGTEYSFVHCAGFLRNHPTYSAPVFLQVPYEWYEPEFQGDEAFKKWEYHINLIGGKVKYKGIGPYIGTRLGNDVVKGANTTILQYSFNRKPGTFDEKSFITENKWVYWEIPEDTHYMNLVYYTFCLIRYLHARHLCRIVSVFYELRKALPKIQCFKLIQLAHHSFTPNEETRGFSNGYYPTWTIMSSQVRMLQDKQTGLELLKNEKDNLHQIHPGTGLYAGSQVIKDLIEKKEFKKAYDELKG